ncbi:MAG: sulfatase-like hydrolase/transferase [Myxococcota bacterium]|nr:sulfatase-like hydrolase/transferase [Myxococcota bacterium]MDW8360878.1 sulfatase-like hydrolase/transferase [Myxococcales bacterium]
MDESRLVRSAHAARRVLIAGGLLATGELAVCIDAMAPALAAERARALFVLACWSTCTLGALSAWLGGWLLLAATGAAAMRSAAPRRLFVAVGVTAAVSSASFAWLLTDGSRIRASPLRPVLVLLVTVGASLVAVALVRALILVRTKPSHARRAALALGVGAALALVLDARVWLRLYPALHAALAVCAVVAMTTAVAVWPAGARARNRRRSPWWPLALFGVAMLATPSLQPIAAAAETAARAEVFAPITGKLLRTLRRVERDGGTPLRQDAPRTPVASPAAPDARAMRLALDLRGRDVLVVTVDALRADRVGLSASPSLTPELDALASDGVVFARAYTPSPHTSYALASLWTGRHVRDEVRVGRSVGGLVTLPSLLRERGHETLAIYPPWIFRVDGERLGALATSGFGFEHRIVDERPGTERAEQLDAWLAGRPPGRPVLAWVHLVEPHEPYEPPEELAAAGGPVERYDGEVRLADAIVGELVRRMRARRADAIVIVTADHGEEFGEHGGRFHGTTLYDEQVRVPLLWSGPGLRARTIEAPVGLVDVAPTLAAALGVPAPPGHHGRNLVDWLVGSEADSGFAFASVGEERMVVDARFKLICADGAPACRLFDLRSDPQERHNVAAMHPEAVRALMAALEQHAARIAGDVGPWAWIERARLGDRGAASALASLLGDPDAAIRARAAEALGHLEAASQRPVLEEVARNDADPVVRAEATIAAHRLGSDAPIGRLLAVATDARLPQPTRRRAALAAGPAADRPTAEVLCAMALDASEPHASRVRALDVLGALGRPASFCTLRLETLLSDPWLRIDAARALGRIGDRRARAALLHALRTEPYPGAAGAQALALARLGERRFVPLLLARMLGEEPIPDAVLALRTAGALGTGSPWGADLTRPSARRVGPWQCDARACRPSPGARLRLPSRAVGHPTRIWVRLDPAGPGVLEIAGERIEVSGLAAELGVTLAADAATRTVAVRIDGQVGLAAFVALPLD